MFFFVFVFFLFLFPSTKKPFSGTAERIFMKLLPKDTGKMEFATSCRRLANVVPPPGEWRMLMSVRQKYETTVLGNG